MWSCAALNGLNAFLLGVSPSWHTRAKWSVSRTVRMGRWSAEKSSQADFRLKYAVPEINVVGVCVWNGAPLTERDGRVDCNSRLNSC